MNDRLQIRTCPTCGSERIQWVVRDVSRKYRGQTYIVPSVGFYDCPNCGEKVYDREAMLKIEAYSPSYRRIHPSPKVASQAIVSGATQPPPTTA